MAFVPQLTSVSNVQVLVTYQAWTTSNLVVANTTTTSIIVAAQANTLMVIGVQPEAFSIRPLMQWRLNTWGWLTQYDNEPGQIRQQGYNLHAFVAYDRKVPGGGADTGSGNIVQLEVPTVVGQPNPMVAILPFPSLTI